MSNIVVAIDFSDCSINALEHAITIADKGGYKITMVWVNNPTTTKILLASNKSVELRIEVEAQFAGILKKYSPGLFPHQLEWVIREGIIYKEVSKLAVELDAMLIVAGTHGASGFEEFWAGSNANKIISMSKCPVITLRHDVSPVKELKRIILPIDSTTETRQKAAFTQKIAALFNAEVFVLALFSSSVRAMQLMVEGYAHQVIDFLRGHGIRCHYDERKSRNNALTIIEYAKEKKGNLISIMTDQETTAANIWLGPYAHQIVNSSPVPVLSIHPISLDLALGY